MPDLQDLSAVEALLEERDAIAGWLARLEERAGDAPEAVRERVRGDYRNRLDGLTDRLREHADTVGASLADDRRERDALMDQARAAREALAEVELRHGVGEYDDERFERERSRHVADLEQVEDALGVVADRIARLEEVHQLVTAPARPRTPEAATTGTPGQPATLPPEPMPWPEEAPPNLVEEPEPDVAGASGDASAVEDEADTDDLLSIFDRVEEGPSEPETSQGPSLSSPKDQGGEMPGYGPLSFTPSGGEPARPGAGSTPPPPAPPPLGMSDTDQSPRFVRPRQERGGQRARPGAAPSVEAVRVIPDPDPILPEVPADTGGEAIARTLRCSECGAMNRPLEWYCEKCGAELSAV